MNNERNTHNQPVHDRNPGNARASGEPYRTRRSGGAGGSGRGPVHPEPRRNKLPVAVTIVIDVLCAALIMLGFYLQNYRFAGALAPVAVTALNRRAPSQCSRSPRSRQSAPMAANSSGV